MGSTYSLRIQNRTVNWSETQLCARLDQLAHLEFNQKIRADLSPVQGWKWNPGFINDYLCGINLAASSQLLKEIQDKVVSDFRLFTLFKKAAARFNQMHPSYAIAIKTQPLLNLKTMLEHYDAHWSPTQKKYVGIHCNFGRFVRRMHTCGEMFDPKIDYEQSFGFIEKRELPKGARVYVRADLHGDLKSLIEHLKTLQKEGLLDENFKCQVGTYLILCGDYMDRGEHSLAVAEFLAMLKMENPDQVFLIRGNHEYIETNTLFKGHEIEYVQFLKKRENLEALNRFYQTMPLAVYYGEEGGQFSCCTHGAFELHIDTAPMIDSEKRTDHMVISRHDHAFSERIRNLADDKNEVMAQKLYYLKQYKIVHYLYSFIRFFSFGFIQNWFFNELYNLFATYVVTPPAHFKLKLAARRLIQLKQEETQFAERQTYSEMTAYNWGDVKHHSLMGNLGCRQWSLCPEDIKHALRLMGGVRKVKLLFRGHQHLFQHGKHNGKIVVTTLPVGMDSIGYKRHFAKQLDRAYLLTLGQKVKEWKKQAFLRKSGESIVRITEPESIFSDRI